MASVLMAAACAPSSTRADQVELIEDDVAQLVDAAGHTRTVPLTALPPGVREGDFVVDGAVEPQLLAQALDRLREAASRVRAPLPPRLSLDPSE